MVLPVSEDSKDLDNIAREKILSAIRAQGLPSVVGVVQGLDKLTSKAQTDSKKYGQRFFQTEFGESVKIVYQQTTLIRTIIAMTPKVIHWREARSYMLGVATSVTPSPTTPGNATVEISGYIRGKPLSVNQLVHITDVGTFQMSQITAAQVIRKKCVDDEMSGKVDACASGNLECEILALSNPKYQEDLRYEAEYDPFAAEQTWPTEEELANAESEKHDQRQRLAGESSEYQTAWMVSDPEDDLDEEGDKVMDRDGSSSENDSPLDQSFCRTKPKKSIANEDDDDDDMSVDDEIPATRAAKLEAYRERKRQEQEQMEFPDEVDIPINMAAKTRFARYRGLKSLRTSAWDPKESLPTDYSRLFQFEDFAMVQRRTIERGRNAEQAIRAEYRRKLHTARSRGNSIASAMEDVDDSTGRTRLSFTESEFGETGYVVSGIFVTLQIVEVPMEQLQKRLECGPLILGCLLKHENRLSVLNFSIQRSALFTDPVKSKQELEFHVGFRRFRGKPVFSDQNLKSDKHLLQRFLPQNGWSVATTYGPTTFQPASVLIFRDNGTLMANELVASGTLTNVNPDRIVLKRVILTGVPVKVKKRKAVIRYMFHSAEDVRWFKPVELTTKHGVSGHIKESLGTHGDFKAIFNKPIKQHDTVCLVLYKRVYPKFCEAL